jgi:3-oxoacyl-[acyl-carrier protein] reductase
MSKQTHEATKPALEATLADFASIAVGAQARLAKTISAANVQTFAELTGDNNPLHLDEAYARRTHFGRRVAHGMLVGSYLSTLIGMQLPGPGALWLQQSFLWRAPVFIGDTVEMTLTVTHKSEATRVLNVEVKAVNQDGNTVLTGEGKVMVLKLAESN